MNQSSKSSPWLTLVRLPNLLTVPGDVLAGSVLVASTNGLAEPTLFAGIVASLLFYMSGLIMNDLVDRETDSRERPERPLPSGAISSTAARNALIWLMAAALTACAFGGAWMLGVGVLLGGLIFFYNHVARRVRFAGAVVMGGCRALNVVIGMVAAGAVDSWSGERWIIPVWWLAFIAALTWLASREVESRRFGLDRWLPMWICLLGGIYVFIAAPVWNSEGNSRALLLVLFAVMLNLQSAIRLGTKPTVELPSGRTRQIDISRIHPPAIGVMISSLIPMQAAVVVGHAETTAGLFTGFLLLIAWPLNRWLARSFAAS